MISGSIFRFYYTTLLEGVPARCFYVLDEAV